MCTAGVLSALTWRRRSQRAWSMYAVSRHMATASSSVLARHAEHCCDRWRSEVRCKPNHSDHNLHGWDRMDTHLTRMVDTTAICSFPPDAFLLQVLEDDSMTEAASDEIDVVCCLPDTIGAKS